MYHKLFICIQLFLLAFFTPLAFSHISRCKAQASLNTFLKPLHAKVIFMNYKPTAYSELWEYFHKATVLHSKIFTCVWTWAAICQYFIILYRGSFLFKIWNYETEIEEENISILFSSFFFLQREWNWKERWLWK